MLEPLTDRDQRGTPVDYGAEVRAKIEAMARRLEKDGSNHAPDKS